MRKLIVAAALVVASTSGLAQECKRSKEAFTLAYLDERMPALLGASGGSMFLDKTLALFKEDPRLLQNWKEAPTQAKAAFITELQAETRVVTASMEKRIRASIQEKRGHRPPAPLDCAPPELTAKYPKLAEFLTLDGQALPIAVALAINGLVAELDAIPEQKEVHKEEFKKLRPTLPAMPYQLSGLDSFAIQAALGMNSPMRVKLPHDLTLWAQAWVELANQKGAFYGSTEEEALYNELSKRRVEYLRDFYPKADRERFDYFMSTTRRELVKPFRAE